MNKRRLLNFGLLYFIIIILTSCSSTPNKIARVNPEKDSISGDFSKNFIIVNNSYEVIDNYGGKISIKIKAIKNYNINELNNKVIDLTMTMLDSTGMPLSDIGDFKLNEISQEKLINLLKNGNGEEVIQFETDKSSDYDADKHADRIKLFCVSSIIKDKEQIIENNIDTNQDNESVDNKDNDKEIHSELYITHKGYKTVVEEYTNNKMFDEAKKIAARMDDGKISAWDGKQTTFTYKESDRAKAFFNIHNKEINYYIENKKYEKALTSANELYNLLKNYPDAPDKDVAFDEFINSIVNSLLKDAKYDDAKNYTLEFKNVSNKEKAMENIKQFQN